jgi:hypothetical protein
MNDYNPLEELVNFLFMIVLSIAIVLGLSTLGHCRVASKNDPNATGFIPYTQRPIQYLEGSIIEGNIHNEGTDVHPRLLTTLRIQPTGTFALFTEDYTFCGNIKKDVDGKVGTVVFAFSSVMHHSDCYDLYSIHTVKSEEPIQ